MMGSQGAGAKGMDAGAAGAAASANAVPAAALPTTFSPAATALRFARRFTAAGIDPFELVEWEIRDAVISNERGETIFEQRGVEFPRFWSQAATNVVVSKYFRGQLGSAGRETSLRQIIGRVVDTMARWGSEGGYFATEEDRAAFHGELTYILLHQLACFNSPVWFNVGIEDQPQCSACFINAVEDTMPSILGLAKTEGMLFKFGSGTGSNLSVLRSSREHLAGGGTASGPVSFMKGFDAFAGVIKSGGKTRRAAKMVILDVGHPDILEFIRCKEVEERKAWALIDAGYDGGFNVPGGAYDSVYYQNANHSVRVTDEFMRAVVEDGLWQTRSVVGGRVMDELPARGILRAIAEATWICGDPGLQFDTTINDWHTCSGTARINASNPCSEYMFLDDTACNLASLNLMRFHDDESGFQVDAFRHACEVVISAMEIIVDRASYPTEKIAANSRRFRPLGIGYANLGALLMARGLPYDSAAGRDMAAAITALMSGAAYAQSTRIAAAQGPFVAYAENREPMLRVLGKHREGLRQIDTAHVPLDLLQGAKRSWDDAIDGAVEHGVRNSQISVLAPTGTIAFMMDCDTTGVEPDIALVKYKRLVGGGMMKIVNQTVPQALSRLGYEAEAVRAIVEFIDQNDTIEGAPFLRAEHLPVFDCAFKPARGTRSIHYLGHLRMLAAAQPFISGAISKTINMPEGSTVDEIQAAYLEGWRMGLKAVAIYRDNCKRSQPLSTRKEAATSAPAAVAAPWIDPVAGSAGAASPASNLSGVSRRKLSDERRAITHKFSVANHEGYLTVGLYDDGQPGEIFLVMAKEGSTISGLMDAFATAISLSLQYGVPLRTLVGKFSHMRFEPSGFTKNAEIPIAKSIIDYIFRWLASKFLSREEKEAAGVVLRDEVADEAAGALSPAPAVAAVSAPAANSGGGPTKVAFQTSADAPSCHECGSIMVRNGSCYKCLNCGSTSGCS
jgi:ribonucleoside-diphosphate reductase alpha chain